MSASAKGSPTGGGRKFLLLGLVFLPAVVVIALLYAGLHDKEATPKWRKKPPPAATTNAPATNQPPGNLPPDHAAAPAR